MMKVLLLLRRRRLLLLLFCCGLSVCGATLEEGDAGRILKLRRTVGNYPAGAFLVLAGLDENEDAQCELLSGERRPVKIPRGAYAATPYFRETPPYEILLDICQDYGDPGFSHSPLRQENCRTNCRLLKVLGHQNLTKVFLALDGVLQDYLKTFQTARSKFVSLAVAEDPDEDAINDLVRNLGALLERKITDALANVTQALNQDDPLLAVTAYLHIRNFYFGLPHGGPRNMSFRNKKCLTELHSVTMDLFRQCENDILTLLKRRYASQTHVKEFRSVFPKARGLWSESPPENLAQLQEYFRAFFRCRTEENEYAPVADFEQWGNLRLSLLLGCSSGKETAYLEQEFQAALHKYQQIFSQRQELQK